MDFDSSQIQEITEQGIFYIDNNGNKQFIDFAECFDQFLKWQLAAPVVTEWKWPSTEEVAARLTDEQKDNLKTLLDNGSYKEGRNAKNWAGYAVAYVLGLDKEDDGAKRESAAILGALMKEGEVIKSEERDPVRRDSATFIRSNRWAA